MVATPTAFVNLVPGPDRQVGLGKGSEKGRVLDLTAAHRNDAECRAKRCFKYEEYHPYGTTAWWSGNSSIDVSRKRYRYAGKEKDEETSLYYHGARYYAPWLGRWASADPAGMVDGPNRHQYVRGNPVRGRDPTGLQTLGDDRAERRAINRGARRLQRLDPSNPYKLAAARFEASGVAEFQQFAHGGGPSPKIASLGDKYAGTYDPTTKQLTINADIPLESQVDTAVHEVQHRVVEHMRSELGALQSTIVGELGDTRAALITKSGEFELRSEPTVRELVEGGALTDYAIMQETVSYYVQERLELTADISAQTIARLERFAAQRGASDRPPSRALVNNIELALRLADRQLAEGLSSLPVEVGFHAVGTVEREVGFSVTRFPTELGNAIDRAVYGGALPDAALELPQVVEWLQQHGYSAGYQ